MANTIRDPNREKVWRKIVTRHAKSGLTVPITLPLWITLSNTLLHGQAPEIHQAKTISADVPWAAAFFCTRGYESIGWVGLPDHTRRVPPDAYGNAAISFLSVATFVSDWIWGCHVFETGRRQTPLLQFTE